MRPTWRLIVDGPVDGAENMALDRAVQFAREAGDVPPTLRLYRWAKPTVTLGRFQDPTGVNQVAARELGVDIVRRFTGGRAVLHDDELTYSVVARTDDGIPRGVAASYRMLCGPLAQAYRLLGVGAELTERDKASAASSACYLTTTRADLSLGEAKLAGSAQVWHGATVLQHGSFTRSRDVEVEARLFGLSMEEAVELAEHTATLASALAVVPPIETISAAVIEAFESVLGIVLEPAQITADERALAETLKPQVTL